MYCEYCKEREVDTSENGSSALCTECREKLIKYPYPRWFFLLFAAILILFVISSFRIIPALKDYKLYNDSNEKYDIKYYYDAQKGYEQLYEKYKNSIPIANRLFNSLVKQYNYKAAYDVAEESILDRKMDEEDYATISGTFFKLERIGQTQLLINEIYEAAEAMEGDVKLEYIKSELEKLAADSDTSIFKPLILLDLSTYQTSYEERINILQRAYMEDKEYPESLYYLGFAYLSAGDLTKASETFNKMLESNKTDPYATEGMAIIEMLNNNKEKSLELAKKAYEMSGVSYEAHEILLMVLKENNKTEEMNELLKDLADKGVVLNPDILSYLNGMISFRDYYVYAMAKE